jgi:hypothetical protein
MHYESRNQQETTAHQRRIGIVITNYMVLRNPKVKIEVEAVIDDQFFLKRPSI